MRKKDEADRFFRFYKKDLLNKVKGQPDSVITTIDERFTLEKVVPAGINYYALMFRKFKGDVRMRVFAYNCGAGLVLKVNGIPYIKETVNYQNRIINFWKRYNKIGLRKLKEKESSITSQH